MKTFSTLALALVASGVLGSVGAAQQPAGGQAPPAALEAKQAAAEAQASADGGSPPLMTGKINGKVTAVEPKARTFAATTQGRSITFSAAGLPRLPAVGETLEITFTLNTRQPDQLPIATSTTAGKPDLMEQCAAGAIGMAAKCEEMKTRATCSGGSVGGGYCHCYKSFQGVFQSLNVCG